MIDANIYLPGWFEEPGAYVLVDGQFGSTGKGLMAGWLAEYNHSKVRGEFGGGITHVTTNQGPNSGHTAYFPERLRPEWVALGDIGDGQPLYKVLTQQLPVASVFLRRMGEDPVTLINAGAVIDPAILLRECNAYGFRGEKDLSIHPNAAMITPDNVLIDKITVSSIAGTGKGVGPAQAQKVLRHGGSMAGDYYLPMLPEGLSANRGWDNFWNWSSDVVFVETAQGFSLGINSSRFYPNVTSRECTVMQACADARIPTSRVKKVIACFRTYPIRVGSTENSSGGCYEDQYEMSWEKLGLEPELTTVTKRVRRIFNWSRVQFRECVAINEPDVLFINFMNYLDEGQQQALISIMLMDYVGVMGRQPDRILGGFGPYSHDIRQLF